MKNILLGFTFLSFLIVADPVTAQNNVGIGTPTPDPSAILDLTSSNQGFLVPRMSTIQRLAITNPAQGLLVYDTGLGCFFYYRVGWISLCQGGPVGPTGQQGATGLAGASGTIGTTGAQGPTGVNGATGTQGPSGNNGITGVTGATGPLGNAGGDLSGTYPNPTVVGLQNNPVSNVSPGANEILYWNGSSWTPGTGDSIFWKLNGNSGTNPANNFIGTTDAQDFVVKTNSAEAMRVALAGNVGIGNTTPNAQAILDLTNGSGTTVNPLTRAVVVPGTTTAPTAPTAGMLFYNSATGCIQYYDAVTSSWEVLGWPAGNAGPILWTQPACASTVAAGTTGVPYSVTSVNATTYTWAVPNGATFNGGNTSNITVDWGTVAPGNYSISVTASGSANAASCNGNTAVTGTYPVTIVPVTQIFNWNGSTCGTGTIQQCVVPFGFTSFTATVYAAQGGGGSSGGTGGLGAQISATISEPCGTTLYIAVGGQGCNGTTSGLTVLGGYPNGGMISSGSAYYTGGGGGGQSDIRVGANTIANSIVAAGGGGGGSIDALTSSTTYVTGGAGGTIGAAGAGYAGSFGGGGGAPGNGTAGTGINVSGHPSCTPVNSTPGTNWIGGNATPGYSQYAYNGGSNTCFYVIGGAGGGGYYGGGGGTSGSGGGGSCYPIATGPVVTAFTVTPGVNGGDGKVIIVW